MAVKNEPLELGKWNSVRRLIIKLLGRYFIWQRSFVTSRRYSFALVGGRWLGYRNTVNEPIRNENRQLSDKMVTLYLHTVYKWL